ncbi:lipase 3-like [Onthophagus taurus]|uniref:lipase 3-like n=1 Tax=Onthophagus taurus TaxID=166361 RepID=UPI0039BE23AA
MCNSSFVYKQLHRLLSDLKKMFNKNDFFLKCLIFFVSFKIIAGTNRFEFDNETYQDFLSAEGLNVFELAKKYGYPLERHNLYTEDGYLIEMHRIPYGIKSTNRSNRPPVLIAHGSGGTSAEFIMMGERSIGCKLVNAGYDVWMGNARGSMWSLKHKKYNRRSKQFWQFSFHEIAIYDYTAEIDYITNITGHYKMFFLGHSQGSTGFFILAAERPDYNERIRLAILMGPTAYTKHNTNPVVLSAADNIEYIQAILEYMHLYDLPSSRFLSSFLRTMCSSPLRYLCSAYLILAMGYDMEHIDQRLLSAAISNLPGGVSFQILTHYGQIYKSRRFQKFDFGPKENLKRYGFEQPPLYNISKITSPVVLMHGKTDMFADPQDVHEFCMDLPNCVLDYFINETTYSHISYLVGKDADRIVNNFVIEMYTLLGRFQKYDYGPDGNLKRYGSIKPPLYNISKLTTPVAIFYGKTDSFSSQEDNEELSKALPNVKL